MLHFKNIPKLSFLLVWLLCGDHSSTQKEPCRLFPQQPKIPPPSKFFVLVMISLWVYWERGDIMLFFLCGILVSYSHKRVCFCLLSSEITDMCHYTWLRSTSLKEFFKSFF